MGPSLVVFACNYGLSFGVVRPVIEFWQPQMASAIPHRPPPSAPTLTLCCNSPSDIYPPSAQASQMASNVSLQTLPKVLASVPPSSSRQRASRFSTPSAHAGSNAGDFHPQSWLAREFSSSMSTSWHLSWQLEFTPGVVCPPIGPDARSISATAAAVSLTAIDPFPPFHKIAIRGG